jgi:Fe2+ transport system protein B
MAASQAISLLRHLSQPSVTALDRQQKAEIKAKREQTDRQRAEREAAFASRIARTAAKRAENRRELSNWREMEATAIRTILDERVQAAQDVHRKKREEEKRHKRVQEAKEILSRIRAENGRIHKNQRQQMAKQTQRTTHRKNRARVQNVRNTTVSLTEQRKDSIPLSLSFLLLLFSIITVVTVNTHIHIQSLSLSSSLCVSVSKKKERRGIGKLVVCFFFSPLDRSHALYFSLRFAHSLCCVPLCCVPYTECEKTLRN